MSKMVNNVSAYTIDLLFYVIAYTTLNKLFAFFTPRALRS